MFEDREKSEAEVQEKKEKEDAMGLEKADVFGMKVQSLQHVHPYLAVCSFAHSVPHNIASQQLHITPLTYLQIGPVIPCNTNNVSLTFPLGMQPGNLQGGQPCSVSIMHATGQVTLIHAWHRLRR
jgi:hypothetical protein